MGVGELKSKSQNVGCWQQILCQASFSKQDPCLFGRQAASVLIFFPSFARLQAVEVEGIILHVSRFLRILHLGLFRTEVVFGPIVFFGSSHIFAI